MKRVCVTASDSWRTLRLVHLDSTPDRISSLYKPTVHLKSHPLGRADATEVVLFPRSKQTGRRNRSSAAPDLLGPPLALVTPALEVQAVAAVAVTVAVLAALTAIVAAVAAGPTTRSEDG
jgi:hypothetical protein